MKHYEFFPPVRVVLDEGRTDIALATANTDLAGQMAVALAHLSAKQNTAPKGF